MRRSATQSTTSEADEYGQLLERFVQFSFVPKILLNGGMITQSPFANPEEA